MKQSIAVQNLRTTILKRQLIEPVLLDQIDAYADRKEFDDAECPITESLLRNVHSSVLEYLDLTQRDTVSRVLELADQRKSGASERAAEAVRSKRQFDGTLTPSELALAESAIIIFRSIHPYFYTCIANRDLLLNWIKAHRLTVTSNNLSKAWTATCQDGTAIVNINGREITGYELSHHEGLERFVAETPFKSPDELLAERERNMTSEEYAEMHPEVLERPVPQMIADRANKDWAAFVRENPAIDVSGEEAQDRINSWISDNGLPLGKLASFHLALRSLNPATFAMRTEKPQPEVRSVVIAEPERAKRFSKLDIKRMTSAELAQAYLDYPDLENQINHM